MATTVERFWSYVRAGNADECWVWTGACMRGGYGRFSFGGAGQTVAAHRFSFELHRGPIENGRIILHRCDNPPCVNPNHLEIGTHADNVADMVRKGRHQKGEERPDAKLSEASAREVLRRARAGEARRALAREFGISRALVQNIVKRKAWRHI